MTTKTKKIETEGDLSVYWCACPNCASMQVSSSDHTRWYEINVDRNGQLRCPCPDNTHRPWKSCKHLDAAAWHLGLPPK